MLNPFEFSKKGKIILKSLNKILFNLTLPMGVISYFCLKVQDLIFPLLIQNPIQNPIQSYKKTSEL